MERRFPRMESWKNAVDGLYFFDHIRLVFFSLSLYPFYFIVFFLIFGESKLYFDSNV